VSRGQQAQSYRWTDGEFGIRHKNISCFLEFGVRLGNRGFIPFV